MGEINMDVLETMEINKAKDYWLEKLSGPICKTTIPVDYLNTIGYKEECFQMKLNNELAEQLISASSNEDLVLYVILLAAFKALLFKYSGQNQINIASPIYKGSNHEEQNSSYIVLRDYVQNDTKFRELLTYVKQTVSDGYKNQCYSMEKIFQTLNLNEKMMQIIFMLDNIHGQEQVTNFVNQDENDICICADRKNNCISIKATYNCKKFKKLTIETLFKCYTNVLEQLVENLDIAIADVELISTKEKTMVLHDFNNSHSDFPSDKTLQQLFEQQVSASPDSIALSYEGKTLTYFQMNERANQLANLLREKGVGRNSIVGLILSRSIEMVVAIMGILKAGGAYLPIDPEYPAERISKILNDSKTKFLLTRSNDIKKLPYTLFMNIDFIDTNLVLTQKRAQITDLDSHPYPDRSLVDYSKYSSYIGMAHVKNTVAIQGSRGCPYNCAYCHKIWPKTHVCRSAENIFEEVKYLYDKGARKFTMIDDIFNLNVPNSTRFFNMIIESGMDVTFFFPNGVRGDILTEDYIDLMVRAGTRGISMALESASPRIQKLIGKNLNIERLRHNLEYTATKHPEVMLDLFWMIGFPTETEEEALMTLEFVQSIKWLHFPVLSILKIYPNTDMEKLAIANGVSIESIRRSSILAYHQLPDTLPFSKEFTRKIQSSFLSNYFLSKDRLEKVLDVQRKIMSDDELIQKYNSYLPKGISSLEELVEMAGMNNYELKKDIIPKSNNPIIIEKYVRPKEMGEPQLKILLLDISQYFTDDNTMLYDVAEPPIGLMYLLTYLNKQFGEKIEGRILKSRFDFNSYDELKKIIEEFKPDIITGRSLTFYKDLFHKTISYIKSWNSDIPIVAGGPYATSDYMTILNDKNIDIVILGEGEITLHELLVEFLNNGKKFPDAEKLKKIDGIAFKEKQKVDYGEKSENRTRDILLLDALSNNLSRQSTQNPKCINNSEDLAYVMYTSGSTGKPKGIMTTHYNVSRVVKNTNYLDIKNDDNILQLSNYAFDGSTFDIYSALLNGAKLVLVNKNKMLDMGELSKVIRDEEISVFFVTTALFNTLVDINVESFAKVRKVLFGGEKVSVKHVKRALAYMGKNRIIHVYGPTETTVFATYYNINEVDEELGTVPIGKPIANTKLFVVDKNNKLQPIGLQGELCVSGAGLAKGYLNRDELTKEKFVNNPFEDGTLMYKTGDIVRWLPGGNIEFIGREDNQVKLRGFRIELREIESRLIEYPKIKEAIVMMRGSNKLSETGEVTENKYLCAYVVHVGSMDVSEIKAFISQKLAEYMVPQYFIQIDKMPLTANGKIDRNAMPMPELEADASTKYEAPKNDLERKLVEIWKEILEVKNVGVNNNFFDLGGQSLNATILLYRINKEFGIEVSLREIFNCPTIKELAKLIKSSDSSKAPSIKTVGEKEFYETSSAQKRLYILDQLEYNSINYIIPLAFKIDGDIEYERSAQVFNTIIERHEVFRTTFDTIGGEPIQKIHSNVEFKLEHFEASINNVNDLIKKLSEPFDLKKAPLIRAGFVELTEGGHAILVVLHHIIADGVSIGLMFKEFAELYNGKKLPDLKVQYKDFSEWQNRLFQDETIIKQEKYWLSTFAGEVPTLGLPTDYKRPRVQSFEGDRITFKAGKELTLGINGITQETKTTQFMVLLAAYYVLMHKYTGKEDIVIGSPIAGRSHADLENVIGMFVNMLAMRNHINHDMTFKEFLMEVKEKALKAYENQSYQFEKLVEKLGIARDSSRNPIFDIVFTTPNININDIKFENLRFTLLNTEYKVAKFDITLNAYTGEDDILFDMEFCTRLYKKETIEKIAKDYKQLLCDVIKKPDVKLKEIKIDNSYLNREAVISEDIQFKF